jgi:cysteine desulfuration protein SufE
MSNQQTINYIQDEIIEQFAVFDDWLDRYQLLIELGNELPPFPDSCRVEENIIEGCQSRVWIQARYEDGKLYFQSDSDAMIVKGIIALLIRILSGRTPDEILEADLYFIPRTGLSEYLSPNRSNGLLAMLKKIKYYAMAYKIKEEESGKTDNNGV